MGIRTEAEKQNANQSHRDHAVREPDPGDPLDHRRTGKPSADPPALKNQVQTHLGVSHDGVLGLVRLGLLATNQIVPFAPWRVRREQLDAEPLQRAVAELKATGRLPKGGSPDQQPGLFNANTGLTTEVKEGAL